MQHFHFTKNKNSFKLISKIKVVESEILDTKDVEELSNNIKDFDKRAFLKVLGVAGLGLAATSLFPKKSEALIIGNQSTSGILGIKNSSNTRINPAKEDGNLATLAGKDFAKESGGNLSTIATNTTPLANLQLDASNYLKVNIAAGSTASAVQIKDTGSNTINPASDDAIIYLRRMVKLMESQATVDSANRQRVTIDASTVTQAVSGTVTATVSNATVTTVNQLSGVDSKYLLIDTARNAYANGVRNNLIWS